MCVSACPECDSWKQYLTCQQQQQQHTVSSRVWPGSLSHQVATKRPDSGGDGSSSGCCFFVCPLPSRMLFHLSACCLMGDLSSLFSSRNKLFQKSQKVPLLEPLQAHSPSLLVCSQLSTLTAGRVPSTCFTAGDTEQAAGAVSDESLHLLNQLSEQREGGEHTEDTVLAAVFAPGCKQRANSALAL